MKDVNIYIYTEYSGSLKSGTGIYHVILETTIKDCDGNEITWTNMDGEKKIPIMGCKTDITKNRLELIALNEALSHMRSRNRITIYTTSDYIAGALIQGWPDKWAGNDFKKKGKPIKHADLWKSIMEQMKSHDVTVIKADRTPYMKTQAVDLRKFKEKAIKTGNRAAGDRI